MALGKKKISGYRGGAARGYSALTASIYSGQGRARVPQELPAIYLLAPTSLMSSPVR